MQTDQLDKFRNERPEYIYSSRVACGSLSKMFNLSALSIAQARLVKFRGYYGAQIPAINQTRRRCSSQQKYIGNIFNFNVERYTDTPGLDGLMYCSGRCVINFFLLLQIIFIEKHSTRSLLSYFAAQLVVSSVNQQRPTILIIIPGSSWCRHFEIYFSSPLYRCYRI